MPPEDPLAALTAQEYSPCFGLAPHRIVAADPDGTVIVAFEAAPLFTNQYGVTMGGGGAVMIDVLLAYAGFAATGLWLPTVELKTSFLAPLDIAPCTGTATLLKTGRTLAFAEARLTRLDARLAVHATATLAVPQG